MPHDNSVDRATEYTLVVKDKAGEDEIKVGVEEAVEAAGVVKVALFALSRDAHSLECFPR
jgi:hypothetical protein